MDGAAVRHAPAPRGGRRWSALTLLLAGSAVVLVSLALRPVPPAPVAQPAAAQPTTAARAWEVPTRTSPPSATATPARRVLPAHLSIPTIDVSTDLVRLGLHPDNTVEVPRDPDRAGWYEAGTLPGQPGSAVVLGHVDSVDGPAVFARLAQLQPGEPVRVRLDDGSMATFSVRRVATYANADFPAEQVYAGDPRRRYLNLVTCGGWYDADLGGWQGNVVVYTELRSR